MTGQAPHEMTDRELIDAYGFFVGVGPVMDGPFPEERAKGIASELGRRAGGGGDRVYGEMSRAWGKNRP